MDGTYGLRHHSQGIQILLNYNNILLQGILIVVDRPYFYTRTEETSPLYREAFRHILQ